MNGLSQNLLSQAKSISQGFRELKTLSLSRLGKVFSLLGKKEKIMLAAFLALAILSLYVSVKNLYSGLTRLAPASGGVYTEGLLGQPGYINPLLARTEPDLSLTRLVFSGLYKYGPEGQIVPDLADGLPLISPDQKQYTINLKRNVTWHNNQPVTADDVVFTIQLLKDPAYKSPLRPLWLTTTVEKLSDYSVRFTTKDISGPFLDNLTLPILPKSVWGGVEGQNFLLSRLNLEAVGNGPYAISEIKKLPSGKVEQITLNSYSGYFGGQAKIDQIIFKFYDTEDDLLNAFHSREILGFGFTPLGSSLYLDKNQSQASIISLPLPQYQIVFFNLNNKILGDQTVRQALNLATDRRQIINDVFKGNALLPSSPWLFSSGQNSPLPSAVDLTQAKTLLDQAGWTMDPGTGLRTKKGQVLELTIATNDTLVNSNAAQSLVNQWRALNLKVNLSVLPSKQLMDTVIKPRNFDVLLFPQKFGADPDPFLFWHSSQVKDPGFNLTGFSDPVVDNLIIQARSTTDHQTRAALYQKFNDLVLSKTPVIFLDQTEFVYAADKTLKIVAPKILYDPSLRFNDISRWYINEKRVWK